MPQYLLNCPQCQHSNEVTTTQAGQTLECVQCQGPIEAPRLGELRQLPTVQAATDQPPPKQKKGGGLFVFGFLLFLLGGVGGAGLYFFGQGKLSNYDQQKLKNTIDQAHQSIDSADDITELSQMYWSMPIDQGLGQWQEPPYVGDSKQGGILVVISYGLMSVGAFGLLLMLIGFFR